MRTLHLSRFSFRLLALALSLSVPVARVVAEPASSGGESSATVTGDRLPAPPRGNLLRLDIIAGAVEANGALLVTGNSSRQQFVVTAEYDSGDVRDVTRQVTYQSDPEGVVAVDATGVLRPLADGRATVIAHLESGPAAQIEVQVEHFAHDPPINFPNQVVPVFTKLGCNGGGCHGKSGGQNGFRLSLLGFEPNEDFEYLTKEARGRRLTLAAPEQSLLLLKGIGELPHGGGVRMDAGDPNYETLRRWIAEGAEFGDPNVAKVASIEVFPQQRIMPLHGEQQLVVVAHYTDGRSEDVTPMAKYEANVTEMADVSTSGYVTVNDQSGDVAVMIRYQSQVAVFRATIPLGATVDELPPSQNVIDEKVFAKLQLLGMPPSAICDDATFLRRATVDIAGRLPSREESQAFLADSAADKRNILIEQLLASTDYADNFANKWSAILRNKRSSDNDKRGTYAFHHWIRDSLHENLPYDEFVRAIVAASGETGQHPPVVWYREVNEINEQVEDTAQLFLGLRIQCARCHHHPFEKWSRHDYYSFSAFFSRVGRKPGEQPGENLIFHQRGRATAVNPKNNETVFPAGLGSDIAELVPEDDPRHALVDWMVEKQNPFFARMLVNRYWKHFFGRGLVEPEDDMRETNPASNPELLESVSRHFVESGYDLKELVRLICQSSTYQLSAEPNEHNVGDKQSFSRYYPKRMNAEVLLDSINDLTRSATQFGEMPAGTRAIQLPDSGFDNYFLKVFGRPEAASACECERTTDANLAQSLHLINSADIQGKIAADNGYAAQLATNIDRSHPEKLRELYLTAFSREPTADEMQTLVEYLDRKSAENKGNLRPAYEDIVWTIINTKEFLFNH